MKKELVVKIGPDGNLTIEVKGVSGSSCIDFSQFLEEELGEVTDREHTSEYYKDQEVVPEKVEVESE